MDIDNPYYNYIISFTVPDIDNVTVVDYDALEHRIYWSDVRTQTIKRAFINGTGVETIISAGNSRPSVTNALYSSHTILDNICNTRFVSWVCETCLSGKHSSVCVFQY